eukprot:CAMPEP_0184648226 /NCGR_PEP_ID=MMETSP0308-20130426/5297_1 /TAXON_ID=38269 /ORGANISM="Gloeochaete witrockiana, Strain SAG 46.84" /LENGTH=404 /DNA_ID=CAMNT_0027079877 /DNA_START=137 /DNA_END=1348 /DNA_ORIENTATION=+
MNLAGAEPIMDLDSILQHLLSSSETNEPWSCNIDSTPLPSTSETPINGIEPTSATVQEKTRSSPPGKVEISSSRARGAKRRLSISASSDNSAYMSSECPFSSPEIEQHNRQENPRSLTQEEKKSRRLEQNRESAQIFRQKKKAYVEELESQVKALSDEQSATKQHMAALTTDNARLQGELDFLQGLVQRTTQTFSILSTQIATPILPIPTPTSNIPVHVYPDTHLDSFAGSYLQPDKLSPPATRKSKGRSKGKVANPPPVHHGGLLLIVFLSVGIVFNYGNMHLSLGPSLPFEGSADSVVGLLRAMVHPIPAQAFRPSRILLACDDPIVLAALPDQAHMQLPSAMTALSSQEISAASQIWDYQLSAAPNHTRQRLLISKCTRAFELFLPIAMVVLLAQSYSMIW